MKKRTNSTDSYNKCLYYDKKNNKITLVRKLVLEKENSEFKHVKFHLKIDVGVNINNIITFLFNK